MQIDIVMPKCGLTMVEGTIVRWLRNEGDVVSEGDPVLEIETEKANIEVPALDGGKIVRLVAEVGSVVPVGDVVAVLEIAGESAATTVAAADAAGSKPASSNADVAPRPSPTTRDAGQVPGGGKGLASPLARKLARELGVNIANIRGTGPRGLVTETDVRGATASRQNQRDTDSLPPSKSETLSSMRKAIASAMTRSSTEAPQVTLTRESGMSGVSAVRNDVGKDISINDVMLATVARVLPRHARLNAHLIGDELRLFNIVNIAIAVALESGLTTPVLYDVNAMSLPEIAATRRDLVEKAQNKALRHSNLEYGTFTITNLGNYGIDAFTPLLNQPQVAILGLGTVKPRPIVCDGAIVIHETCTLSLTFDHRAIDGAPAALFLNDLANLLDDPARLKKEIL